LQRRGVLLISAQTCGVRRDIRHDWAHPGLRLRQGVAHGRPVGAGDRRPRVRTCDSQHNVTERHPQLLLDVIPLPTRQGHATRTPRRFASPGTPQVMSWSTDGTGLSRTERHGDPAAAPHRSRLGRPGTDNTERGGMGPAGPQVPLDTCRHQRLSRGPTALSHYGGLLRGVRAPFNAHVSHNEDHTAPPIDR